MFKYRIISFAALLGLLAGAVFWQTGGGYLFLLLATIAGTLLAHELTRLFEGLGMASHRKFVAGFSGVTICVVGLIMQGFSLAGLLAGLWLFFWCGSWGYILFAHDRKRAVKELLHSCGVFFFTMGIALPLVILYGKGPVDQDNILMLIYMVLVTKAGDTGAYIVGMLSNRLLPGGNHKVVPTISPKKILGGGVWRTGSVAGGEFCTGVWCDSYADTGSTGLWNSALLRQFCRGFDRIRAETDFGNQRLRQHYSRDGRSF